MSDNNQAQYGTFLMRVALGIVMLMHSLYLKMVVFTLAGTASFFGSIGLPEFLAYVVFAVEAVAGIALIVGFKSKYFALALVPILLGATWVHWPNGWLFTAENGGWEYPLFLTFAAVTVYFTGNGAFAIDDKVKTA